MTVARTLPVVAARHEVSPAAPRPDAAADDTGGRPDLAESGLLALLGAFYGAAAREPLLAPYFAPLDMAAHLPRIADFWATVLFHAGRYDGNAFRPHLALAGLTAAHFTRWLAVLEATVDARHAGPSAEQMKAVGHRIAYAMQLRLGITPEAVDG